MPRTAPVATQARMCDGDSAHRLPSEADSWAKAAIASLNAASDICPPTCNPLGATLMAESMSVVAGLGRAAATTCDASVEAVKC